MDPLRWIDDALQDLDDRHLVRQRQVRSGPQSPASITLNGESLVNFASNDYLGLAAEDLLEAHGKGDVGVDIGCASDFFGPEVLNSTVGDRVVDRSTAKPLFLAKIGKIFEKSWENLLELLQN